METVYQTDAVSSAFGAAQKGVHSHFDLICIFSMQIYSHNTGIRGLHLSFTIIVTQMKMCYNAENQRKEAPFMAVYTQTKTYHTKAHMGMIDVTEDFQSAVTEACRKHGISSGIVTGFTTGGVAGLTTLEFEPGVVNHDLKAALDVFSPYLDENGRVVPYWHHETWHDDNGSSHIKAALLSPFITVPFVNGRITVGPWQNLTLVECDTRNRVRDIVFQVMGE